MPPAYHSQITTDNRIRDWPVRVVAICMNALFELHKRSPSQTMGK
jgi:hypothetical protein